jgi:hypothetical protein
LSGKECIAIAYCNLPEWGRIILESFCCRSTEMQIRTHVLKINWTEAREGFLYGLKQEKKMLDFAKVRQFLNV